MKVGNQKKAIAQIEDVHTRGATDIYSAVEKAVQMMDNRNDKSRNPAIMLFTDGQPNRSPPDGEIAALRKLNTKCPIHTFGFGYNLNSGLLYEMAQISSGMNCFIPDAAFVGTVFVNAISNILTTAAVDVQLSISTDAEVLHGDLEVTSD